MNDVRDIMRNSEKVLNSLSEHSLNQNYKFERLYRILFNDEMYAVAYQKIYPNEGNMTCGTDGKNIDGMSIERINSLIKVLRDESYQPNPSRRTYIPKKNGKMRPLGIPSVDDKLVQEVVKMILEAIYEGQFETTSHGFRPHRSCHTALDYVKKAFTGTKWFIEGDIKGFFDNISHDVMINILRERITDERFLRLIRKFLNAGYIEEWNFHKTYSGTPQGGIISPILANIYLDKFDKYVKGYIAKFDTGKRRARHPEAQRIEHEKSKLVKKLQKEKDVDKREEISRAIKNLVKYRVTIPCSNEMDENYRRLKYVRYADDWLVGVIGSKGDCERIKEDFKNYLKGTLKLELSEEKTLITNSRERAKFLGYEIRVRRSNTTKRDRFGNPKRCHNGHVGLFVPHEAMKKKLIEYKAMRIITEKGKEVWKSSRRSPLCNLDDVGIVTRYNSEIRGLYNFYSLADNSAVIHSFYNIMEYSMYKTFASKYQSSVRKIIRKYSRNRDFIITYKNKKGEKKWCKFYNGGFGHKDLDRRNCYADNYPGITYYMGKLTTKLMDRLKTRVCEYCGTVGELKMYHVRKLKKLKGKYDWEKVMIARRRKTIAVCDHCYDMIHAK
jgi:group II intron reverse transcriptase/maturase